MTGDGVPSTLAFRMRQAAQLSTFTEARPLVQFPPCHQRIGPVPYWRHTGAVSVRLDALDNLLSGMALPKQCTFPKLDLQGHEESGLRGSVESLAMYVAAEVEVALDDVLYAETASTSDQIFKLLNGSSFRPIAFHIERWFGGNPPDMDVLFTKTQ